MELYRQTSKSIPQKTVLLILEVLILCISYWILFNNGYQKLMSSFLDVNVTGNKIRHTLLFIFNCIVFMRMLITILYLLRRKMPWEEAISIPFAFAIYYIGFALTGYKSGSPLGLTDFLGILLFILGSGLNTISELQRDKWKKLPENKGHLYTTGLFKYSVHINYFGDILWVSAYALLTHNWYSVIIPVWLFCFFAFFNAPKLDKYLATKYGNEFEDYRKKTKKLIPFLY
jgi:protein-S-isoprenylcysteine O-methyltransferase Ste14